MKIFVLGFAFVVLSAGAVEAAEISSRLVCADATSRVILTLDTQGSVGGESRYNGGASFVPFWCVGGPRPSPALFELQCTDWTYGVAWSAFHVPVGAFQLPSGRKVRILEIPRSEDGNSRSQQGTPLSCTVVRAQ